MKKCIIFITTLIFGLSFLVNVNSLTTKSYSSQMQMNTPVKITKKPPAITINKKSQKIQCNWTINIKDTHKIKIYDSVIYDATLILVANKKGGVDPDGPWKGTVTLILKGIPTVKGITGMDKSTQIDKKLTFRLNYYEELTPLVKVDPLKPTPLIKPDYFSASGIFNLASESRKGTFTAHAENIYDEDVTVETSKPVISKNDFTITVEGAKVTIEVQRLGKFKGTCFGTPIK